jgi:nucleotide-binding universal stress UspA family protein
MGFTACVPLDGTELSESAFDLLPFLRAIGFDHVELISVWESGWDDKESLPGRGEGEMGEISQKGRSYLESYLAARAERVRALGFEVATRALSGRAADHIIGAAAADHVDLVLIATHGRTGVARWRLGSVADKVVREATAPTLVIGPNVNVELSSYRLRRILVPLDGTEFGEVTLPLAGWIAVMTGAEIDLVRVISLTPIASDPSLGMYPVDILTAMEDAAKAYLERIAGKLSDAKVETATLIGSASERILDHLAERPSDLVVMASHARAGVLRATLGSVTDRVLHGPAPVLVLRSEGVRSRLLEAAIAGAGPAA